MADMPARLIAYRIAIARRALRGASSAADRLPALAALVGVASDIRADDLGGAGPARARLLFDEAVAYLSPASALLPVGGDDHRVALYLLARACLGRDAEGAVPDADNAIVCLRRLLTALPAADPDRTEVEALLSNALLDRAVSAGGRASDVDEAAQLLTSMLAAAPAGHPGRRLLTAALAQAHAVRYVGFEGTAADRDAALAYATATLGGPDGPDEPEATAHLVLAWMTLTHQHTPQQRSSMLRPGRDRGRQARRRGRRPAARGVRRGSDFRRRRRGDHRPPAPDPAGVEQRVRALKRPRADRSRPAGADPQRRRRPGHRPGRRGPGGADGRSRVHRDRAGGNARPPRDAADGASRDRRRRRARRRGDRAAAGHLLRPPILAALSHMLGQEMDGEALADDLVTRLDQVGEVLDGLPHDDPEAAHALITLGARILNAERFESERVPARSALRSHRPARGRPRARRPAGAAGRVHGLVQPPRAGPPDV